MGHNAGMNDTTDLSDVSRQPSRLADMVCHAAAPSFTQVFGPATLLKIAVLAGVFLLLHYWQFPMLVNLYLAKPNWSFGFIIPLFSLYLLFARRQELYAAPRRVCWWGLPILILAILLEFGAYYGRNHWLCNLGMVWVIFALVLYLAGPAVLRITWLPILYLMLAMPISDALYERIAYPLQELAAKTSVVLLNAFGAKISVQGSSMAVTGFSGKVYDLTVAEACSGVRSLMAYLALSIAMAYLENRPLWQRIVLVLFTVPIAVACNVLRVVITNFMYVIDKPDMGQDFMHTFLGLLMLAPALLLFWLLIRLMQALMIEEEDSDPSADGEVTA